MANHPSALKRTRSDAKKRLRNRYQHKSTRTLVKELRQTKEVEKAQTLLPKVTSMLGKLAKRGIIHKKKRARLQSTLALHVYKLANPR